MKFLCALLAATTSLVVADHVVDGETCGTHSYNLNIGPDNCGYFEVTDDTDDMIKIDVNVASCTLNGENQLAYITEIRYQICCEKTGAPSNEYCSPVVTTPFTDKPTTATFPGIMEPRSTPGMCDEGVPSDFKVWVDVAADGGLSAVKAMFPAGGLDVKFKVTLDSGTDSEASYFDAEFESGPLAGKKWDGYCVDAGNVISTGVWYNAKAYDFFDLILDGSGIGNIDHPENLDAVAYCINKWTIGTTYPRPASPTSVTLNYWDNGVAKTQTLYASGLTNNYQLSSGTLQKAIWWMVDDRRTNAGLGAKNDGWAKWIAADCLNNGQGFVPDCNDKIPVVVVPNGAVQNQYVQTQLTSLGLTCHKGTADGSAEAYCVTGGSGESGGDPHFKTFGNRWFDFHGGCDLLLAAFPDFAGGLGLTAHARTTTRYDYSYIEAAAIKIGEDILEVFSFGEYQLNGVSGAELLPNSLGGFSVEHTQPLEKQHLFTIDMGSNKKIVIKVFKDLVYVNLNIRNGHLHEFESGVGVLGSWKNGTRFARDGVTVMEDDNEYGQEWQIRDTDEKLFFMDRAPQWPEKCKMPNPKYHASASRRLGEKSVPVTDAIKACAHISDEHRNDMCVYDVLATQDLSVAQGGAY